MFGLGVMEISLILVVALLVFGPKKLPEIGKGLGMGIRKFKKAGQELTKSINEEPPPAQIETKNADEATTEKES